MQPEATDSREIFMQLVTKSSEALQKLEMKKHDPGRVSAPQYTKYIKEAACLYGSISTSWVI